MESYDNSGEQLMFPNCELESIFLCLDITTNTVHEALENGANLIVTHHPLFFKHIKNIDESDPACKNLIELISNRVSIISLHTNLDKIFCRKLEEKLNLKHLEVLFPEPGGQIGLGTISEMPQDIILKDFLPYVSKKLGTDFLIYGGDDSKKIKKIVLLNGAGGREVSKIIQYHHPDCIITGDVNYHSMLEAVENKIVLIDAGHFWTEIQLIEFLENELSDHLIKNFPETKNKIIISKTQTNPFKVYIHNE
jgi:dinuclear metal center YbgI/SA1388 family protein